MRLENGTGPDGTEPDGTGPNGTGPNGTGPNGLLRGRTALVYGAGGPIGGAVARAFAEEGADVFLAGRTESRLQKVARDIREAGGSAETAVVDALDETQVNAFVDQAAKKTKRIDISFNLISYGDVQQPLMEISAEDFSQPVSAATRTHFLTTRAAARHMIRQRSGVVLMFGGSGPQTLAGLGGFKIALDAMEGQRRQWALELGKNGIRVVTLVTGGIVETIPWQAEGREEIVEELTRTAHLNRTATLADVGNVAVFIASDRAGAITDATVNISCGAIVDY